MMYYSLENPGFYPDYILKECEKNGVLPKDLKEISDEDYNSFFNPSDGYFLKFDENGPRLEKIEQQSDKQRNELKKQSLLAEIPAAISIYQTKLLIGRKLNEDENRILNAWLDYEVALQSINLNVDNITWPEQPK